MDNDTSATGARMTDLGPLDVFAGGDPTIALKEARGVIEHAILNQPRTLQTRIGPSEIGTPCDHCLAARLAGWTKTDDGVPWLPFIGTAVHAELEGIFLAYEIKRLGNLAQPGRRWITEAKVMVGHILGEEIWGSTDLLDSTVGMTVDWKIVGAATLRTARTTGPSEAYRVQADLYAKGWNDAGVPVDHVAIAYLPRNDVSMDNAVWWTAPHDRGRAEAALERANRLAANIAALRALGDDAVNAWVTAQRRDPACHDCPRYPDGHGLTAPGHRPPADTLAGLIPA